MADTLFKRWCVKSIKHTYFLPNAIRPYNTPAAKMRPLPNSVVSVKHIQTGIIANLEKTEHKKNHQDSLGKVKFCAFCFSTKWPSFWVWWQKTGSTLTQVMACCLMATSHYLNQWWLIIKEVQWQSLEITQPSIIKIGLKINSSKFNLNFPGAKGWMDTGLYVEVALGHLGYLINSWRAKLFREKINMYLHFMSLLHIDMTQAPKILSQVRPGPTYSTHSISLLLMSWRRKEPGHQQPWYWPR